MSSSAKRNHHEGKPEQEAGFKGGYEPSSREHPKWRVGNQQREPEPRADLTEAIRLTGQWRHTQDGYHLFINQAGPHIELLIALIENRIPIKPGDNPTDKTRTETRLFRLGGDVDHTDRRTYHLYAHNPDTPIDDKAASCGVLRCASSGDKLAITFDLSGFDATSTLVTKLKKFGSGASHRFGDAPNLLDHHLVKPWIPAEVRTAMWFPLTPTQAAKQSTFIFDARVVLDAKNYKDTNFSKQNLQSFGYVELVERYFGISPDSLPERQWRANIAAGLDRIVYQAHSDAIQLPAREGGVDHLQAHYWQGATLRALHEKKLMIDPGTFQSLLTHTQAILDGQAGNNSLANFAKRLHLQPQIGGHDYDATLELVDLGASKDAVKDLSKALKRVLKRAKENAKRLKRRFPFGFCVGLLTVEKKAPGPFKEEYVIVVGGLQLSQSVGSGAQAVVSSGEARNVYGQAWRPEQIAGPAFLFDGGVSGQGGGGGKGASGAYLICWGNGETKPQTPLNINFTGLSDLFSVKPGVGIAISGFAGKIYPIDPDGGGVAFDFPAADVPFEYGVHSDAGPLHFPINGAGLEWPACELLEVFGACELAVLSRPGVTLELHGYADQPDKSLSNMILSRNRAMSVYNYLKNILGDDLATPDLGDVPSEAEEKAKADEMNDKGMPYEIADPSNDLVIIVAHGEPRDEEEPTKKPKYDPELRRAEVYVDGEVRLILRRKNDGGNAP